MKATLVIHLELDDDQNPVWWAESEQLPRTTVVAASLAELRELIQEAIELFNEDHGAALTYGDEVLATYENVEPTLEPAVNAAEGATTSASPEEHVQASRQYLAISAA